MLIHGDCLEEMKNIKDKSIDMILCDPPYGTTEAKWDKQLDFNKLWHEYKRIIKLNGSIILFAQQPFTTLLIYSNIKMFNHNIVWHKDKSSNFLASRYRPRKITEDIIVFTKGSFAHNGKYKCTYNPRLIVKNHREKKIDYNEMSSNLKKIRPRKTYTKLKPGNHKKENEYYPTNLIYFKTDHYNRFHPTQKPIDLLEYLILTYSNKNDIVLDNCMGSGSTIIAANNLKRNFIGIEKDKTYYDIAVNRFNESIKQIKITDLI